MITTVSIIEVGEPRDFRFVGDHQVSEAFEFSQKYKTSHPQATVRINTKY